MPFNPITGEWEGDNDLDDILNDPDFIIALANALKPMVGGGQAVAEVGGGDVSSVNGQTGEVVLDADDISDTSTTNKYATAEQLTKLDGVEDGADVTDTANVTSAGALMDSEVTDLAGVKAVTISTLQPKPSEGAFVDGDKTKLDGIESSADVTDAANVTTALGSIGISAHSDVDTDKSKTPADGDVLTFDGTHWNAEAAAAGGSSTVRIRRTIWDYAYATHLDSNGQPAVSFSGTGASVARDSGSSYLVLKNGTTDAGYAYVGPTTQSENATWWAANYWDLSPTLIASVGVDLNDDANMSVHLGGTNQYQANDFGNKLAGIQARAVAGAVTWYAYHTDGTNEVETDITTALTATTNYSKDSAATPMVYVVDITSGTNIKFYCNGSLLATHTTNLPSGGLRLTREGYMGFVNILSQTGNTATSTVSVRTAYIETDAYA